MSPVSSKSDEARWQIQVLPVASNWQIQVLPVASNWQIQMLPGEKLWMKHWQIQLLAVELTYTLMKRWQIQCYQWRVTLDEALADSNEYCSAVWYSAADTHIKLLDRAVSGSRYLTGGVFEYNIAHRRSVAFLCMLYKIRCNPMHPLNGALPGPYVQVRVTRGSLVAHRYTYAPPRCRTLQYSRTFIPFSVSLWNDLANPVFDGVGLAGFKSRPNASLVA